MSSEAFEWETTSVEEDMMSNLMGEVRNQDMQRYTFPERLLSGTGGFGCRMDQVMNGQMQLETAGAFS